MINMIGRFLHIFMQNWHTVGPCVVFSHRFRIGVFQRLYINQNQSKLMFQKLVYTVKYIGTLGVDLTHRILLNCSLQLLCTRARQSLNKGQKSINRYYSMLQYTIALKRIVGQESLCTSMAHVLEAFLADFYPKMGSFFLKNS